mmetsp:Transcript_43070/g.99114  ORF Transcript_43070/g.99114 Transcript_43070/m.99114 type:complete len:290 (+) Transcript_43070:628-1497(+)
MRKLHRTSPRHNIPPVAKPRNLQGCNRLYARCAHGPGQEGTPQYCTYPVRHNMYAGPHPHKSSPCNSAQMVLVCEHNPQGTGSSCKSRPPGNTFDGHVPHTSCPGRVCGLHLPQGCSPQGTAVTNTSHSQRSTVGSQYLYTLHHCNMCSKHPGASRSHTGTGIVCTSLGASSTGPNPSPRTRLPSIIGQLPQAVQPCQLNNQQTSKMLWRRSKLLDPSHCRHWWSRSDRQRKPCALGGSDKEPSGNGPQERSKSQHRMGCKPHQRKSVTRHQPARSSCQGKQILRMRPS